MVLIQRKEYNILLLGQTGAGKSMFINGFCNYVRFNDLREALEASKVKDEAPRHCIPTTFPWYDEAGELYMISVGSEHDENECQTVGQSGTKCIQSYLFEFENIAIRFIDTPGFGDTDGQQQDEKTCENLISFLSNRHDVQELHGIVFISKPQENRFTSFFKYCLKQIFSKLHKDASQNIIFVFTHVKGTQYKPGPTRVLLEKAINEMSNVQIPLTKNNIFCVENDCMQYLFASFYGDAELDVGDVEDYESPWRRSSDGYLRLLKYVKTLAPHSVQDTVRVNEIRRYSTKLETLLEKIVEKIDDNMKKCDEYSTLINTRLLEGQAVEHLRFGTTYINREGKYCVTCFNRNCPLRGGSDKTVCCPNCKAWTLSWCEQMSFIHPKCKKCGCADVEHTFEKNERNPEIKTEKSEGIANFLAQKQKDINDARVEKFKLRLDQDKYAAEKRYIEECVHKFRECLNKTSFFSDQQTYAGVTAPEDVNENNNAFSREELQEKLNPDYFEMMGEDLKELFEKIELAVPNDKVYDATPTLDKWKELED